MVTIAVDGGHGWYWSVFSIGRIDIDIGVSPLETWVLTDSRNLKNTLRLSLVGRKLFRRCLVF